MFTSDYFYSNTEANFYAYGCKPSIATLLRVNNCFFDR